MLLHFLQRVVKVNFDITADNIGAPRSHRSEESVPDLSKAFLAHYRDTLRKQKLAAANKGGGDGAVGPVEIDDGESGEGSCDPNRTKVATTAAQVQHCVNMTRLREDLGSGSELAHATAAAARDYLAPCYACLGYEMPALLKAAAKKSTTMLKSRPYS